MATAPIESTRHGRSPSAGSPKSPTVAPLAIPPPSSPPRPHPSTSALSASLKAFKELSVSKEPAGGDAHPFASDEFKQAYHHVRFGNAGGTAAHHVSQPAGSVASQSGLGLAITGHGNSSVPALSTSPSTSSEAGTSAGSLPTPPSSSPPAANKGRSLSASNGSLKVKKPSSTLGGVCEGPEIALENGQFGTDSFAVEDDALLAVPVASSDSTVTGSPVSLSVSPKGGTAGGTGSSLFSGGARWGWPTSTGSTALDLASPPTSSSAQAVPMSLPAGRGVAPVTSPDEMILSPASRRRGSLSFASPPTGLSAPAPIGSATSTSPNQLTSPLATSPPTGDQFRMMQPLGRVVSAGATMQSQNGSAKTGDDGFGLFRRLSIGGFGGRKVSIDRMRTLCKGTNADESLPPRFQTRATPAQPPSPPSGFHHQPSMANLPAPTLLEPTHASLSPATVSTTEIKVATPQNGAANGRGRTLAPGAAGSGTGTKARKLSPMGERILRGGY